MLLHFSLNHAPKKVLQHTLINSKGLGKIDLNELDDMHCPTCAITKATRKGLSKQRPKTKDNEEDPKIIAMIRPIFKPKFQHVPMKPILPKRKRTLDCPRCSDTMTQVEGGNRPPCTCLNDTANDTANEASPKRDRHDP